MAGDNFSLRSTIPWFVHVLLLYIAISYVGCVSILEHLVDPSVAPNCSTVTLTCRVDDTSPSAVDVWWTYRGENASKLPDVTMITDEAENGEWKLELKCPTLEHKGTYACNVQARNESEVIYRKEAVVKIYVPVTIDVGRDMSSEMAGGKVNLTCKVIAHPLTAVEWLKDGEPVNTTDGRLQSTTFDVDVVTVVASLLVDDLEREDNGTYVCQASNEFSNSSASQDLLVQEPPEVQFLNDSVTVENPSTVTLKWHVVFDGNLPVQKFILRREENPLDSEKSVVDEDIPANLTHHTVYNLLSGLTYNFQLSAVNEAGHSEWDSINVSMPADVPPRVSWVHVLASTNVTLLFGWRRPTHDNGANITHYNVHLHLHGVPVANMSMVIQTPGRNNLMYLFGHLQPGETYTFQVQACNSLGCGNWSEQLDGTTSDGMF